MGVAVVYTPYAVPCGSLTPATRWLESANHGGNCALCRPKKGQGPGPLSPAIVEFSMLEYYFVRFSGGTPFWALFHDLETFSTISCVPARASQDQLASS